MSGPVQLLPLFLKLSGRRVLLVGGGAVAASKLASLRAAGANVVVVAPEIRPELEVPGVELVRRGFVDADLEGAWLVVAAALPAVNAQVVEAAEARTVFVVAVDDPQVATAYGGGVVRKGDVTVAISTGGRAPALAGLLREALEALLPDEVAQWVEVAAAAKREWKEQGVAMAKRRPRLLAELVRRHPEHRE